MSKAGDRYRDKQGDSEFTLVKRIDPRGPTPPFWSVIHDSGISTTVREDRLDTEAYVYVDSGDE